MERDLDYFLNIQAKILSLVIQVFDDRALTKLSKVFGLSYKVDEMSAQNRMGLLASRDLDVAVYECGIFFFGYIVQKKTNKAVLIGPMRIREVTKNDIREYMENFMLPKMFEEFVTNILASAPDMNLEDFLSLICLIYYELNDEKISIEELIEQNANISKYTGDTDVDKEEFINTSDLLSFHNNGEYENNIIYYVKNGMVNEIKTMHFEGGVTKMGVLGPNQMRSLKNGLIILNSICLRAAITGGLDTETSYTLGERYAQKIEKATSVKELAKIAAEIRVDYCQRVKNIVSPKSDNIYINKISEYIQNHIYEKITVTKLSSYVKVTPGYLSSLSKQYLNCTLPQYINKKKIAEAKKLLRFTDKSLVEIADMLCFSSQSHFQNQFKKIRGITPTKYREKYKVIS